jgi:type I restriction enzyme R subunit
MRHRDQLRAPHRRHQGRNHRREGDTDNLQKYAVYSQMLADWFNEPPEKAVSKVETFETEVKKKFITAPGQMKLLIVVDKLLTGFDAPPATYLYIDKNMRDHGLFQAICRVNRLDGDDKEYGYIVDYKDLFKSLEGAVGDYTSGALDGYDKDDVKGLLEDRLGKAREDLEDAREAVKALCEPVLAPRDTAAYLHYFCAKESGNASQLKDNEPKRLKLYKFVATLIRAYVQIANELTEAGYTPEQIVKIKAEVDHAQQGARRGAPVQRRLHRPQGVRAGHAAPDRHLHPRRREREDFQLSTT